MQSKRINEAIRLYYAALRESAADAATHRKAEIAKRHPELALVEEELAEAGFKRLRSALGAPAERQAAQTAFTAVESKQRRILLRLGLEEDYAPVSYRCGFCHDHGYTNGKPCPNCYPQALAALWNTQLDEEPLGEASFSAFDVELFDDAEDVRESPKRRMLAMKMRMEKYVETFSDLAKTSERPNLLFNGVTGTGKTYLASCMAKALRDSGYSVMMLSAPQLLRIFSEYRVLSNSFNPNSERMDQLATQSKQINYCDFLVIDDLGTEAMDDHSAGDFLSLLNLRERSRRPILLTTNLDLGQLKARYEERIYSRVAGTFQTFAFIGQDLRVKKRKT